MTLWQAILLAIVEGLTEFLPVSSTGHMIIVSHFLGISNDEFVKFFEVFIQFGAILSVPILYWKRLFQSFSIYIKLMAAFIPTALLGLLLKGFIKALLGKILVVAWMLVIGGIILLFVDKWFKNKQKGLEELSVKGSFIVGLFQSLAMVPGVSRSAATIIGGQIQGLSKKAAAEFSFLLAMPTMGAATALDMLDSREMLMTVNADQWMCLAVGTVVAFIVALLAIKGFVTFLVSTGFRPFGFYRIIVGLVLLGLIYSGADLVLS